MRLQNKLIEKRKMKLWLKEESNNAHALHSTTWRSLCLCLSFSPPFPPPSTEPPQLVDNKERQLHWELKTIDATLGRAAALCKASVLSQSALILFVDVSRKVEGEVMERVETWLQWLLRKIKFLIQNNCRYNVLLIIVSCFKVYKYFLSVDYFSLISFSPADSPVCVFMLLSVSLLYVGLFCVSLYMCKSIVLLSTQTSKCWDQAIPFRPVVCSETLDFHKWHLPVGHWGKSWRWRWVLASSVDMLPAHQLPCNNHHRHKLRPGKWWQRPSYIRCAIAA